MGFIALIDYGMGNLLSVSKALEKAGGNIRIIDRPEQAAGCSGLVLPGVGNFGDGMRNLREHGFVDTVRRAVAENVPLLGICLGMQMMLESSEEAPGVEGIGIFKGAVRRFPDDRGEKVPHMGWNQIEHDGSNPFLAGVPSGSHVYFVHSYFAAHCNEFVIADTEYGQYLTAAVQNKNVFGCQFHPEKSGTVGLNILKAFAQLEDAPC